MTDDAGGTPADQVPGEVGAPAHGFVDIHCHGGGGHDFAASVEAALGAAAAHRARGTTRIVASLVSAPLDDLDRRLGMVRAAMEADPGIVGAHLEGPFLAPARKGAHDAAALAEPTPEAVARLIDAGSGVLRQITIAPELPGALDAVRAFTEAGVVVAVGHTEATAAQAHAAFDAGATLLTHAFNAMPPVSGREPGPLGAALADPRVFLEVIADGVHVAPANLRWLFAAAPERMVLVTDAMAAAASHDGHYTLGSLDVEVAEGVARIAGTDTLAGSTLTLDRAIDVCVAAGVPREAALRAATTTPARVLGLR